MASDLSTHFLLFDNREYSVFEYGITFLHCIKEREKIKFNETPNMPLYPAYMVPYFLNHIRNLRKYKVSVAPSMSLYPLYGSKFF